ncbi:MAG: glycosyltransferase family 4 protein [Clostridiales bacterium]|nr:glycosyltransferase family 4 protein [Clostridiales bacterium]
MTVLQVCAYAAPYEGNFIKSLKALSAKLSEKGIRQIYAFPETAEKISWVIELAKTAKVYFLPLSKARIRLGTYKALSAIFKENPDIVTAHSHFELYDVPLEITAPKGVKVFWHLHDALEVYSDLRNRFINFVQYGFLHGRAKLLAVSDKNRDYVTKRGFPKKNAFVLPNGIDTERILKAEKPYGERKFDFLIFGWDYKIKGVDICLNAVKEYGLQYSVAIVTNNNLTDLPGNVVKIRPVKDVNSLYSETKCFLHISRAEGHSYALLESLYAGLPVICSDIPENGFASVMPTVVMTKTGDAGSVANAMQSVMKDLSAFDAFKEETRDIIEKKYSISAWVERVFEFYGI